ncbi:MAG: zinc-binding alcohol dehydrogenase family protein [Thermodesulfobacteriota bacterium]
MKAIVLRKNGGPRVLGVEEVKEPLPGKGEVVVSVSFAGVNYAEILSRKGIYGWAPKKPYIPGMECSGVIEKVGEGVDPLRIGETVMVGTKYGSYAEKIVVPARNAVPAIDGFTMEESASFLVNYMTAWVALFKMAKARSGEKVLVTAAAGGVGTAAIQLASRSSCEVYGMAGSLEKVELIKSLGAAGGFNYRERECFTRLIEATGGVDVVIEMVGGEVFRRSLDSLNPFGRMVITGFASLDLKRWSPLSWLKTWKDIPRVDAGTMAQRSIAVMSSHLGYLLDREPDRMTDIYEELRGFVTEHGIEPVVSRVFELEEAGSAHEYVESRKSFGKVLLKVDR